MSLNRRKFLQVSGSCAAMAAAGSVVFGNKVFAEERASNVSDVSFVGSSASGTRRQMIKDVLEPWRDKVQAGIVGKNIVIKINIVSSNVKLAATDVDAVRGLIDFLREITDQPIKIVESAASANSLKSGGGGWFGGTGGFEYNGYNNLLNEYSNVSLLDMDTDEYSTQECQIWQPDLVSSNKIPVHSIFLDPQNYVISICRPKTHNCQVITGVCKNVLMGAPAVSHKQMMHGQIGWYDGSQNGEIKCLTYNLYQLGNIIFDKKIPALSVLDAWEGMEGEGPGWGNSIMQYCAVAGTDPLAVDRLCAKLMGLSDTPTEPVNKDTPSYTDSRALLWLSNAGIGNYDLNKINFILGSLEQLQGYVKTYKLPKSYTGENGSQSYQTNWSGGPPETVFDKPQTSAFESRYLDPKPFISPQISGNSRSGLVKISFSLPVSFSVSMRIYDLHGKEVRKLGNEYLLAGKYSVEWDRKNNHGTFVPAGQYIIRFGFNGRYVSNKLTLI